MSKKNVRWNLLVSPHLDKRLSGYIELDSYSSKSEFIREAVRDKLKEETKRFKEEETEKS